MNMAGKLEVVCVTSVGQIRPHNEDSTVNDHGIGLVAVADGMGGYSAGEVASALAVKTIARNIRDELDRLEAIGQTDPDSGLTYESLACRKATFEANQLIFMAGQEDLSCHGMGTTIVLGLFYDNRVTIAHVGDSRMYRLRADRLEQITVDHSVFQEVIDSGLYSREEAMRTINRNLVTRALGLEPNVEIDVRELEVEPGDVYLLCSDGLNDMVKDEEIHLTLRRFSANLENAASELVRLANKKGGKDNISVILARPLRRFPARTGWIRKIFSLLR